MSVPEMSGINGQRDYSQTGHKIRWEVLAGYMLVHMLFCNCYFLLLILNPGFLTLTILAVILIGTSAWAALDTIRRRAKGLPSLPFAPWLIMIACLLFWPLTFPLYLTSRQWFRMRTGAPAGHFNSKKSA